MVGTLEVGTLVVGTLVVVWFDDAGHHGLVGTPAQGSGIVGRLDGSGRITTALGCG